MKRDAVFGPDFVALMDSLCNRLALHEVDREVILEQLQGLVPIKGKEPAGITKFTLTVERKGYPINWEAEGRIFEIVGANLRNKTTTLIYLATLLGVDWDEIRPYLNDDKMVAQARNVMDEISDGVRVLFKIENGKQRFEVSIKDVVAEVGWWASATKSPHVINGMSLRSAVDWKGYREAVRNYFDVQVVSKGRDFVNQVGMEEASDLANLCDSTRGYIRGYFNLLKTSRGRKDPKVLRMQVDEHKKRIGDLISAIAGLTEEKSLLGIRFTQANTDKERLVQLLNDADLLDMLDLGDRLDSAIRLDEEIVTTRRVIAETISLVEQIESTIFKQDKMLENIDASFVELEQVWDALKSNLDLENEIKDTFSQTIKERNVDLLLELATTLFVDDNTSSAHKSLADFTYKGLSLETKMLGLSYLNKPLTNLADFRETMLVASSDAKELKKLRPVYEKNLHLLRSGKIQTTEDLRAAGQGVTTLRSKIESLNAEKSEMEESLKVHISGSSTCLRKYKSIRDLRKAYEEARKGVAAHIVETLEDILARYNLVVSPSVGEYLDDTISTLCNQIEESSRNMDMATRHLTSARRQRADKEAELAEIAGHEDVGPRLGNLTKLSDILKDISEMICNWRAHFESNDDKAVFKSQFEANKANLGDEFERVITMINTRIMNRCPFAFVNLDGGVAKRRVINYDYLRNDFQLEGVDKSSLNHGGMISSMTVYGLSTRNTGADFGLILLVDEWGDVGVYEQLVFDALAEIEHLALGVFVDVDTNKNSPMLTVRS